MLVRGLRVRWWYRDELRRLIYVVAEVQRYLYRKLPFTHEKQSRTA
jgi:hypothetical protein